MTLSVNRPLFDRRICIVELYVTEAVVLHGWAASVSEEHFHVSS